MKPIVLPLVTAAPMSVRDNPVLSGASTSATLMVQFDTQGGQVYLVPLTEQAAKGLLAALANWPPIQRSPLEPGSSGPAKVH